MSGGKGQKVSSARHRFSLRRVIACVAICAVALGAVFTGVGYGLGWFAGGEDTSQDVSTESVSSDKQNVNKNEVEDDASVQDADVSSEAETITTDVDDDQGDQTDETAVDPDSEAVVSEEEMPAGTDADISTDGSSGEESVSSGVQNSDQSVSSAPDTSTSQNPSDTSGQSANSSSSSNTGNGRLFDGAAGAQKSDVADTAQIVTVSVYIDSSRAEPYGYPFCLGDMTVSVAQGSSVLDALKATGLAINATNSGYVSSISGLAERACGSGSGWLYFVDGVSPSSSCAKYLLNGGEKIEWIYTCNMGNDV